MAMLIMGLCLAIVVGYISYPFWVKPSQSVQQASLKVLTQIEEDIEQELMALRTASKERAAENTPGEHHA